MKVTEEIILTLSNVDIFPSFKRLLDEGKVVTDSTGRLRYPHGAPVGKMMLVRVKKDGTPKYRESTEEWFDPGSKKELEFKWPK